MDHARNVPDDVLKLLPANGGVVMVNFYPGLPLRRPIGAAPPSATPRTRGSPTSIRASPSGGRRRSTPGTPPIRRSTATLAEVADHIEHIRQVAGIDHVGIGSDFDGIGGTAPKGLEGVETYPALLAELARRGWSDARPRQARRRQRAAGDGAGRAASRPG